MAEELYIIGIDSDDSNYYEISYGYIRGQGRRLIQCKDCKHCIVYYHGEGRGFSYMCKRMYLAENLKATDFCSRFIKKEDNDHE